MSEDFVRVYAVGRIAPSSPKTYEGGWKLWVGWMSSVGNGYWLEKEAPEPEVVGDITAFIAYRCAVRGSKEGTVMGGKLLVVNLYDKQ